MTRKTEPESARDMWWAQQQSSGIMKAAYEYNDTEPEEGALHSTEVSVEASKYKDLVVVQCEERRYGVRKEGSVGWPLKCTVKWDRRMTFEEFRSSEWYGPYVKRAGRVDFDSSWVDSFHASVNDGDRCVDVSFRVPRHERVWWCSSEVPTGGIVEYSMYVYSDGTVGITRDDDRTIERSIEEIIEAIRVADSMSKRGVSVDDDGNITIKAVDDA